MEKYYYDVRGIMHDTCTEPCKVKNNGIMIGSCKCQDCEYCIESSNQDKFEYWIKCSKIKEAV